METLTAAKIQKDKSRVNIYLDGKYALAVSLEDFVEQKLKVGQQITQKQKDKLSKKGNYHLYKLNLLKFATLRPRSKFEIKKWLQKKSIPSLYGQKLIKYLTKLDLLNDTKFSKWWIEQRNNFRPRSKKMLYSELLKKGIEPKTIKKALLSTKVNEMQDAKQQIKKKMISFNRIENSYKKRQTAFAYLARQGYNFETINKIIDQFFPKR